MIEKLKEKLSLLDCSAWELTEITRRGWEFYFIRHRLDQNRAVEVKSYGVKLYRNIDNGKYLGSASGTIPPTASDEEIDEKLSAILYQAGLVKNPYYTLIDNQSDQSLQPGTVDVEKIAGDFIRSIQSVEETANEDLNSYEIFVNSVTRHTLNSNGVEYTCTYPSCTLDLVVNARKEGREIEVYRFFTSGTCDPETLRKDIAAAMSCGRARLKAVPTPDLGTADVVFSTSDAVSIYDYFLERMSAGMKVHKMSDWTVGEPVVEDARGDLISLEALPDLSNSSRNYPVDEEGAVIRERWLIRDGIAENHYGSRQFSQYIGLENSSLVHNVRFSGGSASAEDVRSGDFLEIVEFSDFQVDSMSGDIAGEIRVAYWHHDGEITEVTGGSVAGNMHEAAKTMRFSKETRQYDTHIIPSVTRLKGLRITGSSVLQ